MSRKESITVKDITETAFELARREGLQEVTARKVAAKAGCSTQPIFRVYKNMEELQASVRELAYVHFQTYYAHFSKCSQFPFVNLGMAYIAYASEEKNLFRLLFTDVTENGRSMYEILNGDKQNVGTEIHLAKSMGCKDPGELFMRMWIFVHGAACMTLTDDYDLSGDETKELLEKTYASYILSEEKK